MSSPEKSDHLSFSDAIEAGDVAAVESLIKKFPQLVNHPDWKPPPLHCAILWDQPEIVKVFLDHGSDIELRDPDRQTTPLRYAIMYCKPEIIRILISRGANTGAVEKDGTTALQLARDAHNGAYEEFADLPRPASWSAIVETLLDAGVTE